MVEFKVSEAWFGRVIVSLALVSYGAFLEFFELETGLYWPP